MKMIIEEYTFKIEAKWWRIAEIGRFISDKLRKDHNYRLSGEYENRKEIKRRLQRERVKLIEKRSKLYSIAE